LALNPIPVADTIAGIVKSAGPPPGTPITDATLKTMWEQIITALYSDIQASATVTLPPGTVATVGDPHAQLGPLVPVIMSVV
jgi:hypothetical protein